MRKVGFARIVHEKIPPKENSDRAHRERDTFVSSFEHCLLLCTAGRFRAAVQSDGGRSHSAPSPGVPVRGSTRSRDPSDRPTKFATDS